MIALQSIVVSDASLQEWDGLVAAFPYRSVYHSLGWLQAVEASFGARLRLIKATQDDRCVGLWPWLEVRKGPLRIVGSPLPGWATAYMGPLLMDESEGAIVLDAMSRSRQMGRPAYMACRTVTHDHQLDLKPLGFTKMGDFETYLIDLRLDAETIWGGFKSECRTRIRKAQKNGVTVQMETDDSYIDDYWYMTKEVFAKSHLQPPFPCKFLEQVHQRLFPRQLCMMSAMHEGRRIAMLALPHDDRAAMYWAGGGLNETLWLCPNNLLHWEAMIECQRRGITWYDFISSKGGPGRFKKTFGPTPALAATHWERSSSRLMAALRQAYERRLRRKRRVK